MQQGVTLTQSKVLQGGIGQEWGKTKPLAPAPTHPIAIPGHGSPSPPPFVTVCMCVYIYIYFLLFIFIDILMFYNTFLKFLKFSTIFLLYQHKLKF